MSLFLHRITKCIGTNVYLFFQFCMRRMKEKITGNAVCIYQALFSWFPVESFCLVQHFSEDLCNDLSPLWLIAASCKKFLSNSPRQLETWHYFCILSCNHMKKSYTHLWNSYCGGAQAQKTWLPTLEHRVAWQEAFLWKIKCEWHQVVFLVSWKKWLEFQRKDQMF